ncbi:YciI family protein [Pacificimonas sp. WHA3]|uniref:YciI family protein n=1 Tax=Pacificimonas pallii TaxID=2827236 RepID=A0ABS6SG13_9SPHN|nr:YciI family protein [Pacificimonas pallii]MBV7257354.1 YciI family protein [Pacificimonas pallii]
MPDFAITCLDKPDAGSLRADTRPAHLEYIATKTDDLIVAGPLLDDADAPMGSLIICAFASREEAETFAAGDPYAKAGLFASVTITPWRQVYPPRS